MFALIFQLRYFNYYREIYGIEARERVGNVSYQHNADMGNDHYLIPPYGATW